MEAVERTTHDNCNDVVRERAGPLCEERLAEAIRNYRPKLYGIAFRKLRNAQDAEDALQDGLLLAFKNLSSADNYMAGGNRAELSKKAHSPPLFTDYAVTASNRGRRNGECRGCSRRWRR